MKVSRIVLNLAVVIVAAVAVSLPVSAENYGGGSVQGYSTDTPLDNGTIVQLTSKDSNRVKTSGQSELKNMFGVTVDRSQLPLTLSSGSLQNEVFVAVSGTYNVIVSTQGGPITAGDYVTLSSVDGVGMKASTEEKMVFGRATGAFDGKGVTLGATALKDASGKMIKQVTLGKVAVSIDIKDNPIIKSTKVDIIEMLKRLGTAVAEKEVSPVRVYISMAIMAVSIIAAIAILYSGVRNGVVSIGRNPMSKKSIFRALVEIILTSILILIIGLFAVYLLLKL